MSRIVILPGDVADQIAAGEVVERPASVVKELVENALDAAASTIDVTIEDGGRTLIRVADDGTGMDEADAILALSRHATSKITSAAQLVGVRSFGFRGEALPAMASVSELVIETAANDGIGSHVRAVAGSIVETGDGARRRGTTVSVHRLFHNTPARLKFMRGARSEWRGIADILQAIGVLRHDVHITVRHDGRLIFDWPVTATMKARVGSVWGAADLHRFVDVDDVQGVIRVSGLAERPAEVGTSSRRALLIVNGRLVRDHGLIRAAEAAYRSTIPAGHRPSLVLHLHLPASDVDVNVHPAKTEVRFRDRWPVERAVEGAVRRALGLFDATAGIGWGKWSARSFSGLSDASPGRKSDTIEPSALHAAETSAGGLFAAPAPSSHPDTGADNRNGGDTMAVPPLVQLRCTYLMFEHDEGVILIDQHSAHERILYEQFLAVLERGEAPSQRLLFPMTLHLGTQEAEAFDSHRDAFTRVGFEIDHFGGATLLVHAVPMPHPRFDAERCLRDTLAALVGDRSASAAARHERLAATFACKAAIKAGDRLSPGEMQALYRALVHTTLPAHDVHGRATIVRMSWDELDRRFGRK